MIDNNTLWKKLDNLQLLHSQLGVDVSGLARENSTIKGRMDYLEKQNKLLSKIVHELEEGTRKDRDLPKFEEEDLRIYPVDEK